DAIRIRVAPLQSIELAKRAVNDALVGMGFLETVTHSLISERAAAPFCAPGMQPLRVSDERAKAEPVLRPSLLPSLLRVFAFNRDNGVRDVKLFESGSTFATLGEGPAERVNLAFLLTADSPEQGVRAARGAIERLVQIVLGDATKVEVEPVERLPWLASGIGAVARIEGQNVGTFGTLATDVATGFGIDQ